MNTPLSYDPLWPRTGSWPAPTDAVNSDLTIIGVPTHATSLSATNAHQTPAAVRAALNRYSSHLVTSASEQQHAAQLVLDEALNIVDAGDVSDPDTEAGETLAIHRIAELAAHTQLLLTIGGDNACTVATALGAAQAHSSIESAGLITLDAHHDLRDGRSNGSPVRRLIEMGLNPRNVVQIGIADFANSHAYRSRAEALGITVIHRDEFFNRSIEDIAAQALEIAGSQGGPIHVDFDVDVCDRSVAPACPASLPGGLQAHELRRITRVLAADSRVRSVDIAEVDATADTADARTVRLAALLVLEAAAGVARRGQAR